VFVRHYKKGIRGPLALETDAAQLPGGDYDVLISGRNQGEWELLVTYPIRISRQ